MHNGGNTTMVEILNFLIFKLKLDRQERIDDSNNSVKELYISLFFIEKWKKITPRIDAHWWKYHYGGNNEILNIFSS